MFRFRHLTIISVRLYSIYFRLDGFKAKHKYLIIICGRFFFLSICVARPPHDLLQCGSHGTLHQPAQIKTISIPQHSNEEFVMDHILFRDCHRTGSDHVSRSSCSCQKFLQWKN